MTDDELNHKIKEICEERGYTFKPWEYTPWEVDDGPCPHPPHTGGGKSWPKAQHLRRLLIAELEGGTIDEE